MIESLPTSAVIRISQASFEPSLFAEVDAMSKKTSEYIIPALRRLPGLLHFYAGVSPKGSVVQISVWDSAEHAAQLNTLNGDGGRWAQGYGGGRCDIQPDYHLLNRQDLDRLI